MQIIDDPMRITRQEIGLRKLAGESERRLAAYYGRGRAFVRSCAAETENSLIGTCWNDDMKVACRFASRHFGDEVAGRFTHHYATTDDGYPPTKPKPIRRVRLPQVAVKLGYVTKSHTIARNSAGQVGTWDDFELEWDHVVVLNLGDESLDGEFLSAPASKNLCRAIGLPRGWLRINEKSGKYDWRMVNDLDLDPPWVTVYRDRTSRINALSVMSDAQTTHYKLADLKAENEALHARLNALERGIVLPTRRSSL